MNTIHTVQTWRNAGNKVRVSHFRNVEGFDTPIRITKQNRGDYYGRIMPRGGYVTVEVTTPQPEQRDYMETVSCYFKDTYNKNLGIGIALGRIQKRINEDRVDTYEAMKSYGVA